MNAQPAIREGFGRAISVFCAVIALLMAMSTTFRDEIPTGGIRGMATLEEGAKPAPGITIWARPMLVISEDPIESQKVRTEKDGSFIFRGLQEGSWQLEGNGLHHTGTAIQVGVTEGKLSPASLMLVPDPPSISIYANQRIYAVNSAPEIRAHGFGPDGTVHLSIYKVDFDALVAAGSISDLYWQELSVQDEDGSWQRHFNPETKSATLHDEFDYALKERDREGGFSERIVLPELPAGIYVVSADAWETNSTGFIEVTDIGLVTKNTDRDFLAWVTDLSSGAPIAEAAVYSQGGTTGAILLGKTDSDGLWRGPMPVGESDSQIGVYAQSGDSRALLGLWTGWDDGTPAGEPLKLWLQTDRPIYRPGHTVSYRGVARRRDPAGYNLPTAKAVGIELRDEQDNIVASSTHTLSSHGTFHGELSLNPEGATGYYTLIISCDGNEESFPIEVAAYRKPEYSVKVLPAKPYFVTGEQATVTVAAEYYFGGPVPDAEVVMYVLRTPTWSDPFSEEAWDPGWDSGGEFVTELTAITNERGEATFSFEAEIPEAESDYYWMSDNDYRYNLTASVADEGGKYYEGSGSFLVAHGELALQINLDRWIGEPGQAVPYTVTAKRHDGQPVTVGQKVEVQWGIERWEENPKTQTWEHREEQLGSVTLTLDGEGRAKGSLTADKAGDLVLTASAKDERRHEATARAWCWITDGSTYEDSRDGQSIRIQPDLPKYKVGDNAKLLISGGEPGAQFLLTVESERLHSAEIITCEGPSALIELPITEAFLPNVYVALTRVFEQELQQASAQIRIDTTTREVMVTVTAPAEIVKPGDSVTYSIRTTDLAGAPLSAAVAIGVVDESIYALREDATDPLGSFYPRRWNAVNTSYSFAPIYLDGGDKGAVNADIRTKFLDTAAWFPEVQTDEAGNASVTVELPDNLTQWRATAVAITDDTRVGMTIFKLRARKDLMIRLQLPRTFAQEDKADLIAVLHNETGAPIEVTAKAVATGAQLTGKAEQMLTLPPGVPTAVRWPLTCPTAGEASFTVTAIAGKLNDGVMQTVPIAPRGIRVRSAEGGSFTESTSVKFTLEPGAIKEVGALDVSVSPSLAHSLLNTLDYLIGYPYGCTEQTMSRFLPTVLVADALKTLNIKPPKNAEDIPDMVAKGYARLERFQHGDGGWGWWEYDDSDPWMTAYVLEGFARADAAGFTPPENARSRGINWAKARLDEAAGEVELSYRRGGRLFLLRALALNGETEYVRAKIAAGEPVPTDTAGQLSSAILIHNALGNDAQVASLVERLARLATRDGAGSANWEEDYWGVETTAQGLLALVTAAPDDPLIPDVINWLEQKRKGNSWTSTRDTAITVNAMCTYLSALGVGQSAGSITVSLNGQPVQTLSYGAGFAIAPMSLRIPVAQLTAGSNTLSLEKSGDAGPCYFSAELTQIVAEKTLSARPLGKQLSVSREYFPLSVRRDADGKERLLPSREPATTFKAGDIVRCVLIVKSDADREFIMLRDPIPGGFECIERTVPEDRWSWTNWWAQTDLRDDHIAFFSRHVSKDGNEFSYLLRAEAPGTWQALPTSVEEMYNPDVSATAQGETLVIKP